MPESTLLIIGRWTSWPISVGQEKRTMVGPLKPKSQPSGATRRTAVCLILGAPLLGACSGLQQSLSQFSNPSNSQASPGSSGPPQQPLAVGTGQVKVGLMLPLSAAGNAGVAAQSMKNAGEMEVE